MVGRPGGGVVVITGIACRCPGGADSPERLWELLLAGRDTATPVPADRGWGPAGGSYRGGFLDDAAGFDAEFFGIPPRQARAIDPQQRILLELTWEALERATIAPSSVRGSDTGVYFGLGSADYAFVMARAGMGPGGHAMTGMSPGMASGRVAHFLGCEGPAITFDTSSSSSLVAFQHAAEAVRSGQCGLALAGGAAILGTPAAFEAQERQGALAPDGRCKSFSAEADGTAWAEGAAVVVLERLADARRLGHPVLAVVRGGAINSDGADGGLTEPSGAAQRRVIRQALDAAGLGPSDVDAVEAHATGTEVGDPVEAHAILATYGQDRTRPVVLGSAKSVLGHAQAASGILGVVKTVLALGHGVLPAFPADLTPTPRVDWSAGLAELPVEPKAWPATGRPRRAAVSAFGLSGCNAHVILEQAPAPQEATDRVLAPAVVPLVVSARTENALGELVRALDTTTASADTGLSLADGRATFRHRAVLLNGREPVSGVAGEVRLAVLFAGRCGGRVDRGRELYGRFPVFATAFDAVLGELSQHTAHLSHVVFDEEARLAEHARTVQFAFEVALFRLAESLGARPAFVVGRAIGEVTAAHVAGVLSLADAARLVASRAALVPKAGEPDITRIREVAEGVTYREPKVPVYAASTGLPVGDEIRTAEYWIRCLLSSSRAEGTAELDADFVLELGTEEGVLLGRREEGRGEEESLVTALARLYVAGVPVAWPELFRGIAARRGVAPTYPFRRERFWPSAAAPSMTGRIGHPLLEAMFELEDGEAIGTALLSRATLPWLSGSELPGLALAEVVVRAGDQLSCPRLETLKLLAPVRLPAEGDAELRVRVAAPEPSGRRRVTIFSRSATSDWAAHAAGVLAAGVARRQAWPDAWPPPGATPVPGASRVWRFGHVVFAEVALPDTVSPTGFLLHPMLLEAARAVLPLAAIGGTPSHVAGFSLHANETTQARVRISDLGDGAVSVEAVDRLGHPVWSMESLFSRPPSADGAAVPPRFRESFVDGRPRAAPGVRELPAASRDQVLLDVVRAAAAEVLGHPDPAVIAPGAAFRDLGFDSFSEAELCERITGLTGLRLPDTVVFDEPNPLALARFLAARLRDDPVVPEELPLDQLLDLIDQELQHPRPLADG